METARRTTCIDGVDYPYFDYFYVYRDYEPGMNETEGWLDGAGAGHWDNDQDQQYPWYTAAHEKLGSPYA